MRDMIVLSLLVCRFIINVYLVKERTLSKTRTFLYESSLASSSTLLEAGIEA